MKARRIIVILLIAALMIISFGCGQKVDDTEKEVDSSKGTETTTPSTSTDEEKPLVNKTGFPIVNEQITLKIFGEQGALHDEWSQMDVFTKYQEMTNIKLEFEVVPSQGFSEKKSLLFASGEYPDMFVRAHLSNEEIVKYGSSGVLAPLEELIPEYAPNYYKHMNDYPDISSRITAPDGHIYALSDVISLTAARTDKYWFNVEWLKRVGKEIPTTFDELEDVLRAFKTVDFDGNGINDEIPMGANNLDAVINNICGCWGLQIQFGQRFNVEDGKVSTWVASDEYKDLLMWLNKMYEEGLLDQEIVTQDYARFAAKMAGQKMGFFFNQADDTFDSSNYIGIAPFKGKSDKIYVKSQPVARGNGVFAISSSCEYPEAALRWVDYFYGDEGSIFLRFGVEGKTWNRGADGKPEYVDGILNNPDGSGSAIGKFTIWPGGGAPQWLNEENSIAVASPTTVAAQEALDPYIPEKIYAMPLFTQEINERLLILQNDINTYVSESSAKFVIGELSFDEWDSYVSTLEKIGIEEWVSIYQEALDSLNNK